jgi:hypothetical protein
LLIYSRELRHHDWVGSVEQDYFLRFNANFTHLLIYSHSSVSIKKMQDSLGGITMEISSCTSIVCQCFVSKFNIMAYSKEQNLSYCDLSQLYLACYCDLSI